MDTVWVKLKQNYSSKVMPLLDAGEIDPPIQKFCIYFSRISQSSLKKNICQKLCLFRG